MGERKKRGVVTQKKKKKKERIEESHAGLLLCEKPATVSLDRTKEKKKLRKINI